MSAYVLDSNVAESATDTGLLGSSVSLVFAFVDEFLDETPARDPCAFEGGGTYRLS